MPGDPTKNIMKDLKSSVQINQEVLRKSYKICLIRTQVKNLTCSYQILQAFSCSYVEE